MKTRVIIPVLGIISLVVSGFLIGIMFMQNTGNWPTDHSNLPRNSDLVSYNIDLPDWNFTLSDETVINLEEMIGQTVIFELMATWCSSCESQIPFFESFQSIREDVRIVALSIDASETTEMMATYKTNQGFDWECGIQDIGTFSEYLSVSLIPTILIVDPNGLLRWMHEGTWEPNAMNNTLTSLGI